MSKPLSREEEDEAISEERSLSSNSYELHYTAYAFFYSCWNVCGL